MSDHTYVSTDEKLAVAVARLNPGASLSRHDGNSWIVKWKQPLRYPPGVNLCTETNPLITVADSRDQPATDILHLRERLDGLTKERDEYCRSNDALKAETSSLSGQLRHLKRRIIEIETELDQYKHSKEFVAYYERIVAEKRAEEEADRLRRCREIENQTQREEEHPNIVKDNWDPQAIK